MDKYHSKLRSKKFKGILIILSVIMVVGLFQVPSFATEIEQAKNEKTKLEKKKDETEQKISELEKKKDDILEYIEELDKELNKLADDIETLNTEITDAKVDLEKLKVELELARKTEEEQYDIMKKRIRYMYENGETDYIEIILQAEDIADVLNQVEYMSQITEYDKNLLDKYVQTKKDVAKKEKQQEKKLAELNDLVDELTYEKETVETLSANKSKEVAKYEDNIDESQKLSAQYTSKLEEQEEVIESLIEAERIRIEEARKAEEERKRKEEAERLKLQQQQQANSQNNNSSNDSSSSDNSSTDNGNSGDSSFSGSFLWPVPSSSRITSTFGNRNSPTAGASSYHKGIDIGAPTGTTIVAAGGGSVVIATYNVSAGNYVMIAHGNNTYTVYMHCSKLLVSVGDEVSQGQSIALVGSTGISTGAHLHFGISMNGSYVNPQNYVSY